MYAKIINNKVVEYPITEEQIIEEFPNTSFSSPFIPIDPYVQVWPTVPNSVPYDKNVIESIPVYDNNKWVQSWIITDMSDETKSIKLDQIKKQKILELASIRRSKEYNGKVVVDNHGYYTDSNSQSKYISAIISLQNNSELNINWKTAEGDFVPLSLEDLIKINNAVREFIQRLFDVEFTLSNKINSLTDGDMINKIDLESNW